jgi:hypothetical protein
MEDMSYLDKKYFIDSHVYNCPFCNRNNVPYSIISRLSFNWSKNKICYLYLVKCSSCEYVSLHLSFEEIKSELNWSHFNEYIDIDSKIFYSVPTSFFVLDSRIAKIIRELISEAEGCLKMNFLTGASACMRKSIYELLIIEKINGDSYDERIKSLKKKYTSSDPLLFDVLSQIQQMTSDKIHEQSWDKWDTKQLSLIIATLKTILYDIYVDPEEKKERIKNIQQLREIVIGKKNKKEENENQAIQLANQSE